MAIISIQEIRAIRFLHLVFKVGKRLKLFELVLPSPIRRENVQVLIESDYYLYCVVLHSEGTQ